MYVCGLHIAETCHAVCENISYQLLIPTVTYSESYILRVTFVKVGFKSFVPSILE